MSELRINQHGIRSKQASEWRISALTGEAKWRMGNAGPQREHIASIAQKLCLSIQWGSKASGFNNKPHGRASLPAKPPFLLQLQSLSLLLLLVLLLLLWLGLPACLSIGPNARSHCLKISATIANCQQLAR